LLQCVVAVCCCSVLLQYTSPVCAYVLSATCCNTLQHTATHCNRLQLTRVMISEVHGAMLCPLHVAICCNTMQRTATHCNTLQHAAKHCNPLQLTRVMKSEVHGAMLCPSHALTATRSNDLHMISNEPFDLQCHDI